ncbi:MAG: 16S rRNA (adenine(1518)-N(6)/adenine(1519)-N(6))-dimethyltransferase RsmA [Candidatus Saccharimonadales bacterium]
MNGADIVPNKDLGQHWLNDSDSLRAICKLAELGAQDTVLEIGPGLGSLTSLLLEEVALVVAVEIDKNIVRKLAQQFSNTPKLELINSDIRHFDLTQLPKGYKVVANIPYYLSGFLIRYLSESDNPPSLCVLLVQKEVAERLSARPGKLSVLAVTAQAYWEVSVGPVIKAELFSPPPKVDSQVVCLKRRLSTSIPHNLSQQFFRLVNAGFSQRRKTIANSLGFGLKTDKATVEGFLKLAGINPVRRPQDLSLEEWAELTLIAFTSKE